jgi:hypothetical protein
MRRELQRPEPDGRVWVRVRRGDVAVDVSQTRPQQRVRELRNVSFVQSRHVQRRQLQRMRGRLRPGGRLFA